MIATHVTWNSIINELCMLFDWISNKKMLICNNSNPSIHCLVSLLGIKMPKKKTQI